MKSIIKYGLLLSVCTIWACNADIDKDMDKLKIEVQDPTAKGPLTFNVQLEKTTFAVGDTVKFQLSGNPDLIDFYSGVAGNAYAYHDRDRFYDAVASLSFQTAKSAGNNPDCAILYYSDEFDGNYTLENVKNVNWKPITDRFVLDPMPEVAGLTNTFSGESDITDVFASGTPIYFAWYCTTRAASQRTQFRVQQFTLKAAVADRPHLSTTLYTNPDVEFRWLLNAAAANQSSNIPRVTTAQTLWDGVFNNNAGPFKEGYAVTKALELPKFNGGKDKPTILLPETNGRWDEYRFIYDKVGEYEVVFKASSTKGDGVPVMKTFTITIE